MKKSILAALTDPAKYGGADQAFQKILHWSTSIGITLPISDADLLNNLRQACADDELSKVRLGTICVQIEAM